MLSNAIQEAKKELEKKIIQMAGVFGVGTMFDGTELFIEVAVGNETTKNELAKMFPENKWQGHTVKIKVREQTKR